MASFRAFIGQNATLHSRSRVAADATVLVAVAVVFWLLIDLSHGISAPFDRASAPSSVPTDPWRLPYYAVRSLLRMFAALAASTVFTFIYATAAARSRRAEKVLIPILDVLQSVPVLGFLSVTLSMWLTLFPHSELGVECASVFAIFTSQAWNMTFAFYQALVSQPRDLDEAARLLRLTRWQRFWHLDVPSGIIPLVWNGMMSFGGGWFFLIASEVISVNNRVYALPGIGSYVAAASQHEQTGRLLLAIGVMVVMVVGVNFVFWRPLTAWAERFRGGDSVGAEQQRSVVLGILRRSTAPALVARAARPLSAVLDRITRPFGITGRPLRVDPRRRRTGDIAFTAAVAALVGWGAVGMLTYVRARAGLAQFGVAAELGLLTFARVIVLMVVGTIVWVPIGVWIGLSPGVTRFAQPVVQVLASFPANFLFPFITLFLIRTGIGLNIGGIVLMALGAQWYILFNVIAGASAIPNDLREAAADLRLSRRLRWRTLYGPAVFSSWVTGGITAAGGAWNASIVSEIVSYGNRTLTADGLGAYIARSTADGDFARTLIGVTVMSAFVVGLDRALWRPLYTFAEHRFSPARTHLRKYVNSHDHHPQRTRHGPRAHRGLAHHEVLPVGGRDRPACPGRRDPHPPRGRGRRPARQVRLREVDAAADHRRAHPHHLGRRPLPRQALGRRQSRNGDGVPVLRTHALAHRCGQRGARAARRRRPREGAPRARPGGHRRDRTGRVRDRLPPRALRRHAPAGRLRPGLRAATRRPPHG